VRFLNPTTNRRLNELAGFLGMTLAVLLLLSLLSYRSSDISLDVAATAGLSHPAHNWIGMFGAYIADMLYQLLGYAAILLPVGLILLSFRWLRSRPVTSPVAKVTGYALMICSADALAALLRLPRIGGTIEPGGMVGALGVKALVAAFNPLGADLVAVAALLAALFLTTKFSFTGSASWLGEVWPSKWIALQVDRFHDWREGRADLRTQQKLEKIRAAGHPPVPTQIRLKEAPARRAGLREPDEADGPDDSAAGVSRAPGAARISPPVISFRQNDALAGPVRSEPKIAQTRASFRLPSPGLLRMAERAEKFDEAELKSEAHAIEQKFAEFGVGGHVAQINPGPVVTTFEFKPEAGVKYNRITSLAEDLCLALRAESILIERIPGKATVGIEVPNVRRQTIALREVIESAEFVNSGSKLTIALGKDLIGRIRTAELNQMPHLLIAGATGTGKSVFINSLLISMLYKATPDELKLVLIDPKRLELGLYEDIPHLFTPVVTDPKVASNVLRNATREMENRLKLLAKQGVRNIDQYNHLIGKRAAAAEAAQTAGGERPDSPLPYLVIVIDELADLMMVDTNNVEESITRLAQMARAVGIHLLLATQRPSVDVITGLIKANFPARISFRVATKVDSRTILDANGSESLLGRGDMLYLPSGSSRLERIHGPLVSEDEIVAVCDFWRSQATAAYHTELLAPPKEESDPEVIDVDGESGDGEEGAADSNDNLYEDAIRVVCEMGRASTSTLQRRLRIGYGRAARLIDLMEKDGIVGPADGPRPREVLKKRDWMKEWDQAPR